VSVTDTVLRQRLRFGPAITDLPAGAR